MANGTTATATAEAPQSKTDDSKPVDNSLPPAIEAFVENAAILLPKKYLFRHVAPGGFHEEDIPTRDVDGKLILQPVLGGIANHQISRKVTVDGKTLEVPVFKIQTRSAKYGRGRADGDIFESNKELDKEFNNRGQPEKFQRLDAAHNPAEVALSAEQRRREQAEATSRKLLERMTREQLQEYAEHELAIDLKGVVKKEAILKAIERHRNEAVLA